MYVKKYTQITFWDWVKIFMNANMIKAHIFHNIKFDLLGNIYYF